jgi:hypothetical protein
MATPEQHMIASGGICIDAVANSDKGSFVI